MATIKKQRKDYGQQYIWEAPLDPSGMPMAKGDSNGIWGMPFKLGKVPYSGMNPITSKAQKNQ